MTRLSLAMQRAIAGALLFLLVAGCVMLLLRPVTSHFVALRDELRNLQERLARYEQLLASRAQLEALAARMESPAGASELFLQGGNPSIVAANLQELVNDTLRRHDARLLSSQLFLADPLAGAVPIGLRIQIQSGYPELVRVIDELERARPVIFIDNLTVTGSVARSGGEEPAAAELSSSMDLVAYQLGGDS